MRGRIERLGAKTAVITGAGSGIGRAVSLALARRGFAVGISDIDVNGAAETLEMVRRAGGSGEVWCCDVRSVDEIEAMADYFFETWGGVGIVVNNAGVADVGYVGDIPVELWQRTVNTNLWGVIYGCHSFIPRMKAQGFGHIINTASAAGFMNMPEMGPYNTVKAGIIALSETLKVELAPFNVGVTVLCPTFIDTNLFKNTTTTDEWEEELVDALFCNAKVTADEVAEKTLRAVDRNRLYVAPQFTARWAWRLKRVNPGAFCSAFAAGYRAPFCRPVAMFFARRGMI